MAKASINTGDNAQPVHTRSTAGSEESQAVVIAIDGSDSVIPASATDGLRVDSELPTAALLTSDGTAIPTAPTVGSVPLLYNGATLDFERGHVEVPDIIPQGNYSTLQTTATQTNPNNGGVVALMRVITAGASGSIQLKIQSYDLSAGFIDLLAGTAVTATGSYRYTVAPGVGEVAGAKSADVLPRRWRIGVINTGGQVWEYRVSYILVDT